jgi:hypothetical protein
MDQLLGHKLDPMLAKRLRDEAERRIFAPYLARHDNRWLYSTQERTVNNWSAVCNAGVVGAALYFETDLPRLAEMVARAARSLQDYLDTFDPDGGSSEGPGYWEYGFGYYTVLADLVERRTGGQVAFLAGDRLRKIASYPMSTVLSPGCYVNFSDCDPDVQYSRAHLTYLAQRLELPELAQFAMQQPTHHRRSNLTWLLRDLFWAPPATAPDGYTSRQHDWFSGMMWMIARYDPHDPAALILAAKGGHNGEMHNQNDVGSFIVHLNGESIIPDLGRGRYTKAYFGPERYEHLVNSSLGHSTPAPNGQLQQPGRDFAAQLIAHTATDSEDTLLLELCGVYPAEARLASLRRQLTLHRQPPRGWVEVVDTVEFADGPGHYESALLTFGEVILGDGALVIHGDYGALRISYDDQALEARMDLYEDVDLAKAPRNVWRIVLAWREPAPSGSLRLEIVPVAKDRN